MKLTITIPSPVMRGLMGFFVLVGYTATIAMTVVAVSPPWWIDPNPRAALVYRQCAVMLLLFIAMLWGVCFIDADSSTRKAKP